MKTDFYETDRAVAEYLHFHYGNAQEILPHRFGPAEALHFPVRCVTECLDPEQLPTEARGLDLGCAVGRSAFELARHCAAVIGIDYSERFIQAAARLQREGSAAYSYALEGNLTAPATAIVAPDIDRSRVQFEQGDAQVLRKNLGRFDVVLMANLIDRLPHPRLCLAQLPELLSSGGQLIVTSPYTWLTDYTPEEHWLGGFEQDGKPIRTLETLQSLLEEHFQFVGTRDLPFLIREHARKFQWSVAEASRWIRR